MILYGFGCLIGVVALIIMRLSRGGVDITDGIGIIPGISGALALMWFGRLGVKGTLLDPLAIGIGSIVSGVMLTGGSVLAFAFVLAWDSVSWGDDSPAAVRALEVASIASIPLLFGLGMILAGVLALKGRADYKAYRRAAK